MGRDTGSASRWRDPYPFLAAELVCAGLAGTVVNTSVTVAVAAIADDFGASVSVTAVAVVLLNVGMAFLMPLAGLVNRAFGPRRVLVGSGIMALGSSLIVSASPNIVVLGIGRLAQGAALAALVPTSVQATTQLLAGDRRGKALGWWAASNGLGLAFAPLAGGLLIDLAGWRWVTLPSCLVAAGLVVAARLAIPRDLRHDPGIRTGAMLSLGLVTGTVMAALAGLSMAAWPAAGLSAAACAVAIVLLRRRIGREGDLGEAMGWLHDRAVRRTALGAALQMVANGMVQITVPAWLIVGGVLTAGPAAAVVMAMTLTMAVMGPLTGRAPGVRYERWLRGGLLGCAGGLGGLALAAGVGPWWMAVPSLGLLGVGAGALLSPSLTAFSHTVAGENAVGLAMFNVLRLSSFAVGGLVGGVSLGVGLPWLSFSLASVACLGAGLVAAGNPQDLREKTG